MNALVRVCSGQGYFGGHNWGICLNEAYMACPWWRLKSRNGKRTLRYATFEQAQRKADAIEKLLTPHREELEKRFTSWRTDADRRAIETLLDGMIYPRRPLA